jgi:hypothetical protein
MAAELPKRIQKVRTRPPPARPPFDGRSAPHFWPASIRRRSLLLPCRAAPRPRRPPLLQETERLIKDPSACPPPPPPARVEALTLHPAQLASSASAQRAHPRSPLSLARPHAAPPQSPASAPRRLRTTSGTSTSSSRARPARRSRVRARAGARWRAAAVFDRSAPPLTRVPHPAPLPLPPCACRWRLQAGAVLPRRLPHVPAQGAPPRRCVVVGPL